MKSGNAVSVQLDDDVQIVVIIALPAGWEVKASTPMYATPIRARPIHTPEPSRKKRTKKKIPVLSRISSLPAASRRVHAPAAIARHTPSAAKRRGRSDGIAESDVMIRHPRFLDPFMACQEHAQEMVDERQGKDTRSRGHDELGNPQRCCVLALAYVMESV